MLLATRLIRGSSSRRPLSEAYLKKIDTTPARPGCSYDMRVNLIDTATKTKDSRDSRAR